MMIVPIMMVLNTGSPPNVVCLRQTSYGRSEEQATGGPVVGRQVNSAKSVPCESLLHEKDCHKATVNNRNAFCGAVGEPKYSCSEAGLGCLGCLKRRVSTLARQERRVDFLLH
jgi:hypothetical protein